MLTIGEWPVDVGVGVGASGIFSSGAVSDDAGGAADCVSPPLAVQRLLACEFFDHLGCDVAAVVVLALLLAVLALLLVVPTQHQPV